MYGQCKVELLEGKEIKTSTMHEERKKRETKRSCIQRQHQNKLRSPYHEYHLECNSLVVTIWSHFYFAVTRRNIFSIKSTPKKFIINVLT